MTEPAFTTSRRGVDGRSPLTSVDDIGPGWCSAVLGASIGAARVEACSIEPLDDGQVADTHRVRLDYDRADAGPSSVVVKLASRSGASRVAARVTSSYRTEVGFYRDLGGRIEVRHPHCHHASLDADGRHFTLVLEDLAPARPGDQLAGCAPAQIEAGAVELARLHGGAWGRSDIGELEWLRRHDEGSAAMASLAATLLGRFLRRYGDRLSPEVARLVERFAPVVGPFLTARPGARTLTHGDFRADNLMFGTGRPAVVDWQRAAFEPALTDVAYLLGGSLPTEVRRDIERDVVAHYHQELRSAGVDLPAGRCWSDYRRYALCGVLVAVVASMLVGYSQRGDRLFLIMTERHGRHAIDLDALDLVPTA